MRTSRTLAAAILVSASLLTSGAATAGDPYASPEAAYEYGIRAYRAGNAQKALPALDYSARNGVFLATYYLARIYSSNGTPYTNHAEAFRLYQYITTNYRDTDRQADYRAPFVAKSLIAMADYWRAGVEELGIAPNPARARRDLEYAAMYFDDSDAQFELARLYLDPAADDNTHRAGVRWLTTLIGQKGHALAGAYLADLFATGTYVPKSQVRALALITLAAEYASDSDRIAIEAQYHKIYCRTQPALRKQAEQIVQHYHEGSGDLLAPVGSDSDGISLATEIGEVSPSFECGDGVVVQKPKRIIAQDRKALGNAMSLGLKSLEEEALPEE